MKEKTLAPAARLTAVKLRDGSGNEAGKVVEWMMDVEEGRVVYVVAELEDGNYYAVPWTAMSADLERGGYTLDISLVKKADVRVNRGELASLSENSGFHDQIEQRFGAAKSQSTSERSGPEVNRGRQSPGQDTGPSNAELAEGKGYGG